MTPVVGEKKSILYSIHHFCLNLDTNILMTNKYIFSQGVLLVLYRLAGGNFSLLAVCLSVSQSVTLPFSGLSSAVFRDIDLKYGI